MKMLTLLFKRSQFSKSLFIFFPITISCVAGYNERGVFEEIGTVNFDDDIGSENYVPPKLEKFENRSDKLEGSLSSDSLINVYPAFSKNDDELHISPVPGARCSEIGVPIKLRLPLLIEENMPIQFVDISGPHKSTYSQDLYGVAIGKFNFWIPVDESDTTVLKTNMCRDVIGKENSIHLSKIINSFLNKINPNCKYSKQAGIGWRCELPTMEPKVALQKLKVLQKTILKKWKRPPYAYLRRLMVTRQLAKIFKNESDDNKLNKFCSLLQLSIKNEIPLIMQSEDWRTYLCSGPSEKRNYWAKIGIQQAEKELEFIKQLLEESNTTGMLKIKIPKSIHKADELWVKLEPGDDVINRIIHKAVSLNPVIEKFLDADFRMADKTLKVQPSCWSPIFQNSSRDLNLSALMSLTGSGTSLCFISTEDWTEYSDHATYLASGIIGETDFIVGNGKYKVLQLPNGSYRYTLKNLPRTSLRWYPSLLEDKSSGEITWISKRPRPIIKNW